MAGNEKKETICGTDCCRICERREACGGCIKTGGRPFGGRCIAAEIITESGFAAFEKFKQELMEVFNSLGLKGLEVRELYLLSGSYVNLEYPLANGQKVKFLKDDYVYLGNQIEIPGNDRCYGIVGDKTYILVCSYGCQGSDPQILCYKKWNDR